MDVIVCLSKQMSETHTPFATETWERPVALAQWLDNTQAEDAVEQRIRAGKPEALAVDQWPWMVGPWTRSVQPGFWTGNPELGRV